MISDQYSYKKKLSKLKHYVRKKLSSLGGGSCPLCPLAMYGPASCSCSTAGLKLCVLVLLAHTGLLCLISKLECKIPISLSGVPCSQDRVCTCFDDWDVSFQIFTTKGQTDSGTTKEVKSYRMSANIKVLMALSILKRSTRNLASRPQNSHI